MITNFFHLSLLLLFLDPGSWINIPDPQHWFLNKLTYLFNLFTTCLFQDPPSSISDNRRKRSRSIPPLLSGTTAASTPRKSPPNSARGPARIAALSHTRRRTVLVGQHFVNLRIGTYRKVYACLLEYTVLVDLRLITHVGSRRMYLDPDVWFRHWLVSVSIPT
jgi:hypothetical protein